MGPSWQTSAVGLFLICAAILGMALDVLDKATGGLIIATGLGFLVSKDHNVTGGTKRYMPKPK